MWLQRPFKHPRVICVLGMHRSGTSFLTGSLQQAGVELHKFHSDNPHNRKGNRENQDIVDLNERVLADNGGSWDNPPEMLAWSEKHLNEAREIVSQYEGYPIWGFKDPRTVITFDGWHSILPELESVGIFRHPVSVARSLQTRDQSTSIDDGLALWGLYNKALLAHYDRQRFPIICFDKDLDSLKIDLRALSKQLKLPGERSFDFYETTLVHHLQTENAVLPEDISEIYQRLLACAL